MKIENKYAPFYKHGDIENGEKIMIASEVKYLGNLKYPGWFCDIEKVDGKKLQLKWNDTSRARCSVVFGDETKNWIGKYVIFKLEHVGNFDNCKMLYPVQDED